MYGPSEGPFTDNTESVMKNFEYSIFIGRFQPFHLAHYKLLQKALGAADNVIIVVGSHNRAINIKNPWTSEERETMIRTALSEEENARIKFIFMRDYLYNDNRWVTDLQERVKDITGDSQNVILIGSPYDKSSYYLGLFPQWNYQQVKTLEGYKRATEIRSYFFSDDMRYKEYVHNSTAKYLIEFRSKELFDGLQTEHLFLIKYRESWGSVPYPPTFVTVDAVVIKSGHVLVVRRGGVLGKGLVALPGGFLGQYEKTEAGMLRELKEETGIKLPKPHLRGAIAGSQVFDHPERSLRGRTITHAYLLNLGSGALPKVKGGDDADKAWWMPLNEFYASEGKFFEDHWHIILHFVSKF